MPHMMRKNNIIKNMYNSSFKRKIMVVLKVTLYNKIFFITLVNYIS